MQRKFTMFATCALGLAAAFAAPDRCFAGKDNVIYEFQGGGQGDGALPFDTLIRDKSGNFYGTTESGGTSNIGTVFKLTPGGTETVLHSFAGGSDGSGPFGGVVMDKKGDLFGTTRSGGSGSSGTLFEVAANGTESVLYAFSGQSDGGIVEATPIIDKAGNLYGTAAAGGNDQAGTIYEFSATGTFSVLYTFTGGVDGYIPEGKLIMDSSGNLYGTTFYGGTGGSCIDNCGVVFKLDTSGTETVLYSFQGGNDGADPAAGVVMDGAGNLYGTTENGGGTGCIGGSGCGTVFKLTPGGVETVLYTFAGGTDGGYPLGDVIENKGSVYGTTSSYGNSTCSCGTVFKVPSSGKETTLHAFTGSPDGSQPHGGLLLVKKDLYGTTAEGGTGQNNGVVFKLKK